VNLHPSRPEVGREQAARFRGEHQMTDARAHEARRDEEWRRRWHALVVDGMTTTDAQTEARRRMHAEGWWFA
jgi:hypothetical protein